MTFDAEKADAELNNYLSGLHPAQRQFFLRHAVYEQIIAAIPPEDAILQGGAGVRYLVKHSAQTKDVDMLLRDNMAYKANLLAMSATERNRFLVEYVRELFEVKANSFCILKIIDARNFHDLKATELASQLVLEAQLGSHKLEHTVELDFGIQTHPVSESNVAAHNLLKFAGIENKSFVVLSPEDLAAIKICIYLEDAGHPERFRPQDIAHCVALTSTYKFDTNKFAHALAFNAFERGIEHRLKHPLPKPTVPHSRAVWQFEEIAKQCKISTDLAQAIKIVGKRYETANLQAYKIATSLQKDFS